uniref:Uncharacterized protein n=1 Tax=Sphaerodactylus townsendi TaxID=933632 RepID=A0ACB8EJJ3_9SAUR
MTEGVIHIAGSSSEGDASEGSSWARRRRQLQRKRRRRCLQAASSEMPGPYDIIMSVVRTDNRMSSLDWISVEQNHCSKRKMVMILK